MSFRWRPKNAEVDPDNPRAWGVCDRCGMTWNLDQLQWQYAYQGSTQPQNTRFLVCPSHLDPLNPQDMPVILPPDPVPVYNARPEPYALDETSWLTTEDGDILTTQDDDPFVTAIPNPSDAANTSNLYCSIAAPGGSVATLYLDLFDGNPLTAGRSILSAITGSSVRTDVASSLEATSTGIYKNTSAIVVSAESESQTNISYAGLYTASISGSLLMSGPVSVSQTIALGNPVQFSALGLVINTN